MAGGSCLCIPQGMQANKHLWHSVKLGGSFKYHVVCLYPCRCSMLQHLSMLFAPVLMTPAPEPMTIRAHASNQLSAAVDESVWRQAHQALNPPASSPVAGRPVSSCRSAENTLEDIYSFCTSRLTSYSNSDTGPEHAMQSLCAVHACSTAFMQLSFSTQMLSSGAQLQPDQAAPWSQLMAYAQKHATASSAQTCWPHVMRLPPSPTQSRTASSALGADLYAVQALLSAPSVRLMDKLDALQALLSTISVRLMDKMFEGSFQEAMHYRLLDIAMLQAWCYVPAPTAAVDKQQPAKRLAGFIPNLAKLLSHLVKMTDHHVMLALKQQLAEVKLLDKLGEVRAVLSMGLDDLQV